MKALSYGWQRCRFFVYYSVGTLAQGLCWKVGLLNLSYDSYPVLPTVPPIVSGVFFYSFATWVFFLVFYWSPVEFLCVCLSLAAKISVCRLLSCYIVVAFCHNLPSYWPNVYAAKCFGLFGFHLTFCVGFLLGFCLANSSHCLSPQQVLASIVCLSACPTQHLHCARSTTATTPLLHCYCRTATATATATRCATNTQKVQIVLLEYQFELSKLESTVQHRIQNCLKTGKIYATPKHWEHTRHAQRQLTMVG